MPPITRWNNKQNHVKKKKKRKKEKKKAQCFAQVNKNGLKQRLKKLARRHATHSSAGHHFCFVFVRKLAGMSGFLQKQTIAINH